ncbi:MAG: oxygen-independent coproporphyrinogen III oxidase [Candidatus Marinimicrobia bacterium]|nr:oxygen-independent coproporphyrinogen III oxidase [Candidatus Neomarinimicrobiota bacterium]|tara:strand:- start:13549 stop:15015 length:1467 start_codon:yes stop_codon:yes gene_type:complete
MNKEILTDINLLKKYHHNLVYDYTEYPTKANWDYSAGDKEYRDALKDWIPNNKDKSCLFYVHTPFCEELCYFCLCSKEITNDYNKVKDYLDNYLLKELDLLIELMEKNKLNPSVEEIYMGGGSPTYYHEKEFEVLLNKMRSFIDFNKVKTFTVEIDPRRVDLDRLRFYHECGVNRLSFGVQDFDHDVQEEINRIQPPEMVAKLLTPEIRELFPVINFDLLIGLPRQTPEKIAETIRHTVDIGPDEIQTMYVHYKPDVRKYMTRMVRNNPMPDFYERKAIFVEATESLMQAGYKRAGFESFAKPSDPLSKAMDDGNAYYNSLGTQTGEAINFIAVGSSAHGSLGDDYYFQNYYEQNLYKKSLDKGEFPVYRGYKLTTDDKIRRDIIKRIRTYFLVDYDTINNNYSIDFKDYFSKEMNSLKEFEQDGLVRINESDFVLTELGKHMSPQVASVFDAFHNRPLYNSNIITSNKYNPKAEHGIEEDPLLIPEV